MTINKIVDAHLHLFDLRQGDYLWLKKENPPFWPDKNVINKNFTEQDLELNSPLELAGFVHIEAGFDNQQPWREIAWLEASCHLPFKTVASIDLTLSNQAFIKQIEKLLTFASVVGCRHILDEQAADLLSQPRVQANLAYLAEKQLSFDLQMSLTDKKAIVLMADILNLNPKLVVIINHAGWPPLLTHLNFNTNHSSDYNNSDNKTQALWLDWQAGLTTLSEFPQCAIKCSAWEMADKKYHSNWQQTVIKSCLTAFGDSRVMLASNFPLTLFSQSYQRLWQSYDELNRIFTKEQLTALTYKNAVNWYRLEL